MAGPIHHGRRRTLRAGAAAAATALAAPGLRAHEQARGAAAALQIVGPWEIGGLAPASSGYVFTRLQVAETLLGAHDDGSPAPALAQRWSVSADGLEWRFTLRPSARFHDGTPVTAAAVARCLQAARTAPALLSQAPIAGIDAEGPATLRLGRPHAALPALLAHFSTLVLAPASFDAAGRVRAVIGSGPYRVTRLEPPQEVEAAAFDGYDGPRPPIAQVRYLTASRAETRALMAESGQADLAFALDPMSQQRLRRRPHVRMQSTLLPRTVVLKLNAGLPALADPRVRRALSLCVDRAGIAHALLRDPALAATQLLPPVLPLWHDPALPPLAHDPAQARRLLAEAGWQRGADGLLQDAQGRPLRLALRTFPDRPELPLIATALQAQWREVGIAVRVAVGNSGDIPLGHRDGSLELGLAARNYASVPDPIGALLQDYGPRGGDWGAMGWSHPEASVALAELARGVEPARGRALRARLAAVLQAELPVIPIAWYRQQVAVSPRLAGVSLDPFELSYRLTRMEWRT